MATNPISSAYANALRALAPTLNLIAIRWRITGTSAVAIRERGEPPATLHIEVPDAVIGEVARRSNLPVLKAARSRVSGSGRRVTCSLDFRGIEVLLHGLAGVPKGGWPLGTTCALHRFDNIKIGRKAYPVAPVDEVSPADGGLLAA